MTPCPTSKTPYATATAALRAAQAIRARRMQRGAKKAAQHGSSVEAYRCPTCAAWHLGRDAQPLTQRRRQ
jgi:hypothetical protein